MLVQLFIKILTNTVFCSVPEEIFPMAICLFFLGKFNIIELDKVENKIMVRQGEVFKFFIPVVLSALASNIFRYTTGNADMVTIFGILTMIISTIVVYKIKNYLEIVKTVVFTFLGGIILILVELSYIPAFEHAIHKTLQEVNNNIYINFLFGLPGRLICFLLIALMIRYKTNYLETSLIKVIMRSRCTFGIFSALIIINFIILFASWKLVAFDNIFANATLLKQVLINIAIIIFPLLNMSGVIGIIFSVESSKKFEILLNKKYLNTLTEGLEMFYINKQYDKMEVAIKDIKSKIADI